MLTKLMPAHAERADGCLRSMNEQKKFPSSVDVARRAGVSQSAVSRAFSSNGSVSEKTRAKILAAADELGYQPSAIPRIMLTHRSHLVAVATGGMYNPFNSQVLEQFARSLQDMGYQMILVHVEAGDSIEAAMPRLASYRVDAIFVARGVLNEQAAASLANHRIPIIAFHTPVANEWVSSVCTDNIAAGRMMADHFADLGARRCAFLGGPHPSTTDRLHGFREALVSRRLAEPVVLHCPFTYEAGEEGARQLLRAETPPDAVFCANDLVAIGFIYAARQMGYRVPDDVMVSGFDDIPEASWSGNSVTTIGQLSPTMVEMSLDILGRIRDSSLVQPVQAVVPVRLIERKSTAGKLASTTPA
jgi:DNA-binding LacI/PurR family transcriptional regulator